MTNLNTMYMFAFRYALGRKTFAPNIVASFLSERLKDLSTFTITQMMKEIDECEDYGDNCDTATWTEFRCALERELASRESESHEKEPEECITWTKTETECKPTVSNLRDAVENTITNQLTKVDNVNHPLHYCDGKIEVIDYIEDKKLGYHLGNVVKYVSRAGKKRPDKEIEDLQKARWYLDRYIEKLESERPVIRTTYEP